MSLWSPSITTGVLKSPREMRAGASSVARSHIAMSSSTSISASTENTKRPKLVWVWTENKKVMTAAVERGWSTFLFNSAAKGLADEWNCLALIRPLFIESTGIFDGENKKIGVVCQVSSPQELKLLQPDEVKAENVVVNFGGEWQIIPAENIVAAFQGCEKNVFAIASTCNEAQTFFEALEQGLGGVVLKAEDVDDILKLKDYFDRRNEVRDHLPLITATVTQVKVVGMGDRVCVDLCSLMQPGEGLMVGSFARGLFLVHSECFESRYIASRPFRVNAGPVHAYVAVPGGRTCYLSELEAGKEVIVVDGNGLQRTAIVGRVKVETRQLVLVEAEEDSESKIRHSIFLQNAETVGLICPRGDNDQTRTFIPVTSLSVGDKVIMRLQGGARHTGIEIKEFILEK